MLNLEKNLQSELGNSQRILAILHKKKAQLVKVAERKKKQEQGIANDISSFYREPDDREEYQDLKDIGQEIKKLEEDVSNESKAAKDFTESPFDRQHQSTYGIFSLY